MNEEAKHCYRGVSCLSCRQPIPLPEFLLKRDSTRNEAEHLARVFSLRCRACEREKPYRTIDIVDFEGLPRVRGSRAHLIHAAEWRPRVRSRAAGS